MLVQSESNRRTVGIAHPYRGIPKGKSAPTQPLPRSVRASLLRLRATTKTDDAPYRLATIFAMSAAPWPEASPLQSRRPCRTLRASSHRRTRTRLSPDTNRHETLQRLVPRHFVPYVPYVAYVPLCRTRDLETFQPAVRGNTQHAAFVYFRVGGSPVFVSRRVCGKPLFLCTAPVNRRSGDLSAF